MVPDAQVVALAAARLGAGQCPEVSETVLLAALLQLRGAEELAALRALDRLSPARSRCAAAVHVAQARMAGRMLVLPDARNPYLGPPHPTWMSYLDTEVHLGGKLRWPTARAFVDELAGSPVAWIVTAENPASRPLGARENAQRREALELALRTRGLVWLDVLAQAVGGGWAERSVELAGLGWPDVLAMAEAFGQNAVYAVDSEGTLDVVACRER